MTFSNNKLDKVIYQQEDMLSTTDTKIENIILHLLSRGGRMAYLSKDLDVLKVSVK